MSWKLIFIEVVDLERDLLQESSVVIKSRVSGFDNGQVIWI